MTLGTVVVVEANLTSGASSRRFFERIWPANFRGARFVGGGVKAVEKRRFEIPKKSWHGFCLIRFCHRSGGKAGRRKKGFGLEVKKIPAEEDGFSNRQDSTTFVPLLTRLVAVESAPKVQLTAPA